MTNFIPTPRVPGLVAQHPLAISDLIHLDSLTWNLSLLKFLFDSSFVAEILRIKIRTLSDALLWTASSSGCFTTKLAYHLFTAQRPLQISLVLASS
jgi:hypothetical protein